MVDTNGLIISDGVSMLVKSMSFMLSAVPFSRYPLTLLMLGLNDKALVAPTLLLSGVYKPSTPSMVVS